MTAGELRRQYQEIGGDEARSRNREYLIRRILWMLQAGAYGGLSERAAGLSDGFEFRGERRPMLAARLCLAGHHRGFRGLRFAVWGHPAGTSPGLKSLRQP